MKNNICPKCNSDKILKIKDVLHASGGGNISYSKNFFTEKSRAFLTFYICEECGYVEQYLDEKELKKLKQHKQ